MSTGALYCNKKGGTSNFGTAFTLHAPFGSIDFGLASTVSLNIPFNADSLTIHPGTRLTGLWNIANVNPPPYTPNPIKSDINVNDLYADGTVAKPIVFSGIGPTPMPGPEGYYLNPWIINYSNSASLSHYSIDIRYTVPVCTITTTP